jgi:molecular chaperone Hsp33
VITRVDTALRALTEDQAFRVMTVSTTETVRGAIASQKTRGEISRTLGELITAAILFRETMAPDLRVQVILQGESGHGRIVADAHPRGETRALVQIPTGKLMPPTRAEGGRLIGMRTLHDGSIQQGVVSVGKDDTVSDALMQYMQTSEQVTSVAAVGCVLAGEEVLAAGGYIVQLLPHAPEGPLMLMTERLADFPRIEDLLHSGAATPDTLMSELLYGIPHDRVGESNLSFKCQCSEERVLGSLATLPRRDIEEMLSDGKVIEVTCDYCGSEYNLDPERLRGLLANN